MTGTLTAIAAMALFLVGLKLSAFFSGVETGFYRASFLRLNIDAHAGDRIAEKILWFARTPSSFVTTALVGNNVANYVTTLAIGVAASGVFPTEAGSAEILGTLLVSPVVFLCGELIPKNLYFRAPLTLLRRDILWFRAFYRLFLVVSFPLTWITKILQRIGGSERRQSELVLGRSRLVQVLSQGHREGLLIDVQNRLVDGLMQTAAQQVTDSMTPVDRVLGVSDQTERERLLDYARRFGLSSVLVRRDEDERSWYGYVRVLDAAVTGQSVSGMIRETPQIPHTLSKLEALLILRHAEALHGQVRDGDRLVGIVSERGLIEQLFRPPKTATPRFPVPR